VVGPLDVNLADERFDLFVHCTPLGGTPEEFWVIQPAKKTGILRTLFTRPRPGVGSEPLCRVLLDILNNDPKLQISRILDWETFRNLY